MTENELQKNNGDAGYRSPYLSHAKRALYHLSYIPWYVCCQRPGFVVVQDRVVGFTVQFTYIVFLQWPSSLKNLRSQFIWVLASSSPCMSEAENPLLLYGILHSFLLGGTMLQRHSYLICGYRFGAGTSLAAIARNPGLVAAQVGADVTLRAKLSILFALISCHVF
jgi:hypothetical protein